MKPTCFSPGSFDLKRLSDALPCASIYIYFDLETTSLLPTCHIIQLAGCFQGSTFNRYVIPKEEIDRRASAKNGLTFVDGQLFHHDRKKQAIPIKQCLEEFLAWLERLAGNGKVTLVGHNSKQFDAPRFVRAVKGNGLLPRLMQVVHRFADTLPLFRELYRGELTRFNLPALVKSLMNGEAYGAHNAREDAKVLAKLVEKVGVTEVQLDQFSFSLESVVQKL